MSKTFSITLAESPATFVERAGRAADRKGITFRGTTREGDFMGRGLKGRYRISDGTLLVEIEKKPSFLPWETVRAIMIEFLGDSSF
jgi:hypothetical protein